MQFNDHLRQCVGSLLKVLQFRNECNLVIMDDKDWLLLQTLAELLCYPANLFTIEPKGSIEVWIKVVTTFQVTQITHVQNSV